MNLRSITTLSFVLLSGLILAVSCTKDKAVSPACDPPVVYEAQVKPILAASCNISGCHESGFAAGDFTTYEGIKAKAENGSLTVVLEAQVMPPNDTDGQPLTKDQRQMLLCWVLDNTPRE